MSKIKKLKEAADDVMMRAQIATLKDAEELMDELREMAEYEVEVDEEGHEDISMANYSTFCDNVAARYINLALEETGTELGPTEIDGLIEELSRLLGLGFEKYYHKLIDDVKEGEDYGD